MRLIAQGYSQEARGRGAQSGMDRDRAVERDKLRVIAFRNIDPEAAMNCGNKVQKIQGVDVERFAQIRTRVCLLYTSPSPRD